MITQKTQNKIQVGLVGLLLKMSYDMPPREFQVFFESLLANIVSHLPDDYWSEVCKTGPCEILGCNCHVLAEVVMAALDKLRKDHKYTMDEKDTRCE